MTDLDRRADRMERTRWLIRAEFAVAIAAVIVTAFLFVAVPGCMCGMFAQPSRPSFLEQVFPWMGPTGIVVGFAAMARLARIDPEAGERTWRYRE